MMRQGMDDESRNYCHYFMFARKGLVRKLWAKKFMAPL